MIPVRFGLIFWLTLASFGADVRLVVLATTDLHGNIYPYDYLTGQPAARGLARLATLIKAEREASPHNLLIDVGDTIQGAPIESVWQSYVRTGKLPLKLQWSGDPPDIDPMMLAMNHLGYAAMTVGNHEFNFGLANLERARNSAKFPWLSANTRVSPGGGRRRFEAYVVKTIAGVKVAIVGVTTPAVPAWEKAENIRDYSFTDAAEACRSAVADLRRAHNPDLVIAAVHAGLERDLKSGAVRTGDIARENMVHAIATEVPGIDAIVFGHTHAQLENFRVGNVLLTQPKNWGISLARMEFVMQPKSGGGWQVREKSSRLLPVTENTAADPEVLQLARPYHEITEKYLNTVISESPVAMDATESRVRDSAIIDAVHAVQLHYAKADVSFASSFNPRAAIPNGPLTVRQIAALYVYDNELYAIEGTGKMVREALENAARFYNTCPDSACTAGPLLNRAVIPYNYDMAQGVTYEIDLRRAAGSRIHNLAFRGKQLADDQKLRLAVNNYRAGGSAGYIMFRNAPVVWRSYDDIRELIIRYYSEHKLPAKPDSNWRVVPESALHLLQREVRGDTSRPLTQ